MVVGSKEKQASVLLLAQFILLLEEVFAWWLVSFEEIFPRRGSGGRSLSGNNR